MLCYYSDNGVPLLRVPHLPKVINQGRLKGLERPHINGTGFKVQRPLLHDILGGRSFCINNPLWPFSHIFGHFRVQKTPALRYLVTLVTLVK